MMSSADRLACQTPNCNARTAYLVDDCWPEFERYIQSTRTERDYLFLPALTAEYNWNTQGFDRVFQHRSILALRATHSLLLRLLRQPSKYQEFRLSQARYLAQAYSRRLSDDLTHLVVTQSLLPYLWQAGHLQERSFDVLMTALPIDRLQQRRAV
jgi:hypothetical protein